MGFGTKHNTKLKKAPMETPGFKPSALIFSRTDIVMFSSLFSYKIAVFYSAAMKIAVFIVSGFF